MAIFNKSNCTSQTSANTTIITTGAKLKGEIALSCNLYIDGELDGIIKSTKEVNIGKNGHIKGELFAERLVVQGFIEGVISSNIVEIKAGGHIRGEITSKELIIESKAIFEGSSIMQSASSEKKKLIEEKKEA